MAHRSITSIWTTVLAALVALLAVLGLTAKAAPAAAADVTGSAAPATAAVRRPVMMARRTWRAMMRGGSLPPTIKQRIRAEAHGKTPSVRRSTTAAALAAEAPVGTPVGTPAGARVGAPVAAPSGAAREGLALAA
ncbi:MULTISPECIES: DUF6344 domain-containing protein [unclassified Streptomyces]|uniref:DUF6344 domain-containing protein n=1 Tax=unclassified Streptomyces TaxID=2593676 RepID=UPI002257584F|nr:MULTISPECIES: DUF6344 domain-containing protein [unclassified Streptomyces]MCX4526737.1 DUF6344 domain-containing protein [Streptomyces sp. NBC_01551]MCX4542701.1 DUF6344 domain-containing protein [Streptomyces sp. NBC_01565]